MMRQAMVIMASAWCVVNAQTIMAAPESPSTGQPPFRYNAKGHRDPFIPLVRDGQIVSSTSQTAPIDASKPVLHGILWDSGGQSIALINDTEVKIGDMVGEYQVTEIRHDTVVLSNGGESMVLDISFGAPSSGAPSSTTTGGEGP